MSIIPGIETGAPDRTLTSRGLSGLPKDRPVDDPRKIDTLDINDFDNDFSFFIEQLFHTDFNRCYKSIKELLKFPLDKVLYYLNNNWDRAKSDYGAIYFFINAYKVLLDQQLYDEFILDKVDFLLSDFWPN